MEELDLFDVIVVANDTGGGLVLASLGVEDLDISRIARLVLTNCDSYEHFPPGSFAHIVKLCRFSAVMGAAILRLLATGPGRNFFMKTVSKHPPVTTRQEEIFGAFATSRTARRDAVALTASLDPALTLHAAEAIDTFDRPVTLVWGTEDRLFPLDHARRLRDAFPRARLTEISGSSAFVMLDAPVQLANAIRRAHGTPV